METYAHEVGLNRKFNYDGTIGYFPGNTIICDLSHDQEVQKTIQWIHERFKLLPFAKKFAYMPPESIHMTVIELLCHYNREESLWSSELALDVPIDDTDVFFANRLLNVVMPANFTMKVDRIGTNICLRPSDQETEQRLRAFRDEVAHATGVKFPNHDNYEYHITYAYRLVLLTPDEEAHLAEVMDELTEGVKERLDTINTGQVLYTVFEDMSKFVPYAPDARKQLKKKAELQTKK